MNGLSTRMNGQARQATNKLTIVDDEDKVSDKSSLFNQNSGFNSLRPNTAYIPGIRIK